MSSSNASSITGTRVVEISRSTLGFGFTLSGEKPCRLTQVKDHAITAGLRSGDRLHSVNGECVEGLQHDHVVSLITGAPGGKLLLRISTPDPDAFINDGEEEDVLEELYDDDDDVNDTVKQAIHVRRARRRLNADQQNDCKSDQLSILRSAGLRSIAAGNNNCQQQTLLINKRNLTTGISNNNNNNNNKNITSSLSSLNVSTSPSLCSSASSSSLSLSSCDSSSPRPLHKRQTAKDHHKHSSHHPHHHHSSHGHHGHHHNNHHSRHHSRHSSKSHKSKYRYCCQCQNSKCSSAAPSSSSAGATRATKTLKPCQTYETIESNHCQVQSGRRHKPRPKSMLVQSSQSSAKSSIANSITTLQLKSAKSNEQLVNSRQDDCELLIHQHYRLNRSRTIAMAAITSDSNHCDNNDDHHDGIKSIETDFSLEEPLNKCLPSRKTNSTTSGISSNSASLSSSSSSSSSSSPSSSPNASSSLANSNVQHLEGSVFNAAKTVPIPAARLSKQKKNCSQTSDIYETAIHRVIARLVNVSGHCPPPASSSSFSVSSSCYSGSSAPGNEQSSFETNKFLEHIRNESRACVKKLTQLKNDEISEQQQTRVLLAAYSDSLHLVPQPTSRNGARVTLAEQHRADNNEMPLVNHDEQFASQNILACFLPLPECRSYFTVLVRQPDSVGTNDHNTPNKNATARFLSYLFQLDMSVSGAHSCHLTIAKQFSFQCSNDPITGLCTEFPDSAEQIVRAIHGLYRQSISSFATHREYIQPNNNSINSGNANSAQTKPANSGSKNEPSTTTEQFSEQYKSQTENAFHPDKNSQKALIERRSRTLDNNNAAEDGSNVENNNNSHCDPQSIIERNSCQQQNYKSLQSSTATVNNSVRRPSTPERAGPGSSSILSTVEHFMLSSHNGIASLDRKDFVRTLPNTVTGDKANNDNAGPGTVVKFLPRQRNPLLHDPTENVSTGPGVGGGLQSGDICLSQQSLIQNTSPGNTNGNSSNINKQANSEIVFEGVSPNTDYHPSYRSYQDRFDSLTRARSSAQNPVALGLPEQSADSSLGPSKQSLSCDRTTRAPITDGGTVSCRSVTVENGSKTLPNARTRSQEAGSANNLLSPSRLRVPTSTRRPQPIVGWPSVNSPSNQFGYNLTTPVSPAVTLSRTLSHFDLSSPGPFYEKQVVPIDVDDSHFILQPVQSCNDLATLSAAYPYEIQFSPSRVRQATQRYFNNTLGINTAQLKNNHHHHSQQPLDFYNQPQSPHRQHQQQNLENFCSEYPSNNRVHSAQNLNRSQSSTTMNFNPFRVGSSSANKSNHNSNNSSSNNNLSSNNSSNNSNNVNTSTNNNLQSTESLSDLRSKKISEKKKKALSLQASSVYCGEMPIKKSIADKPGRSNTTDLTHQNSEPTATSKGNKLLTSASVALGDDAWEGSCESSGDAFSERPVDVGWVGGWASDFDALLNDPVGVKAFQEFSRQEFCSESLQFFLEVQDFKKLVDPVQLRESAHHIYNTYISSSASDPVNVDSKARKAAEFAMKIDPISCRAFHLAEKQIYNLMKFDSYQRFLKSKFYNDCALTELKGKTITLDNANNANTGDENPNTKIPGKRFGLFKQSSKDKSNRKSFIPIGKILKSSLGVGSKAASFSSMQESNEPISRLRSKFAESISKMRSKSLDEHIQNQIKLLPSQESVSSRNSADAAQSTNSSLADKNRSLIQDDSLDLSENVFSPSPDSLLPRSIKSLSKTDESSSGSSANPSNQSSPAKNSFSHNCNRDDCHFIRVLCPDRSQTVITPQSSDETLDSLISRLFEKRNWSYPAYDIFLTGTEKPLEPTTSVSDLGCAELRIERRALFQIIFPDGDMIGVTAKLHRTCSEVLGNLLARYNYRRDHVVLKISESNEPIKPEASIATLDNQVIIISYRDDLEEYGWRVDKNNIPAALNSPNKSISSGRGDDTRSDSFFGKLAGDSSDIHDNSPDGSPYKIVKSSSNLKNHEHVQRSGNHLSQQAPKRTESCNQAPVNYRPSLKNLINHNHFQSHKDIATTNHHEHHPHHHSQQQHHPHYDPNVPALIPSTSNELSLPNEHSSQSTKARSQTAPSTTATTTMPPPLPPKNVATINSVLVGQLSNPPQRPPPLSSINSMNKFTTNQTPATAATADASYV